MITVLAEKFDIGLKIAVSLSEYYFNNTRITMKNIEEYKPRIEKEIKPKGVIYIKNNEKDYAITWASGHLLGLKQAKDYNEEYSMWSKIPFPFFPKYEIKVKEKMDYATKKTLGVPDPWTEKQLYLIGQLFKNSEYIISATDDDREGELIFAYIYQYLKCSVPYKKIKLDSQTEEGFKAAFANQIDSSKIKGIEFAGRCRAIFDWLAGANISGKMTLKYIKYIPELSMITIGRIQTYVLNLIVERELAIKKFKSHPFWYVVAEFTTKSGEKYTAKHSIKQIEDKQIAEDLLKKINGKQGVVTDFEKVSTSKEVPLLYNLSSLSRAANEKFGISSNDCLKICQDLYERGFITYPRTDSQHLTSDMHSYVDNVLEMLAGFSDEYGNWINPISKRNYTSRHFDTKKVESHFAIIPTNVPPSNLNPTQKGVYDLIAKSIIRIIYKSALGEKTTITTEVDGEIFKSKGTVIIEPQWLIVDAMPSDSENLPKLNKDEIVDGVYELKEGKTEPPKRYTDATLTAALETASKTIDDEELKAMLENSNKGGIGRPSTRGPIIDTVVKRYCTINGKQIIPTSAAIKLVEIIPIEEFKSAEMTASWESRLDRVQKGEETYSDFVKEMEEKIKEWCLIIDNDNRIFEIPVQADTSTTDISCPKCGKPMRKLPWGWACSGYVKDEEKACKFAIGYNLGHANISDKDIETLITNKKTRYIEGFKSQEGSEYGCFLILDAQGNLGRTWETGFICPKCNCGSPIVVGKKGWSCSNQKCDFIIWDEFSHKKLTTSEKQALIENKKTKNPVKNLLKKSGEKYDSVLILDDDFKVSFPKRENKK